MTVEPTQSAIPSHADIMAATRLLIGERVGGGDGNTFVALSPSLAETALALATARKEGEAQGMEKAAGIADEISCKIAVRYDDHPLGEQLAEIATAIRTALKEQS